MWLSTTRPERFDGGEIRAAVSIPADSPWFDGHFPGEPVLPAIALLDLVWQTVRHTLDSGTTVSGFRRIKFRRMVRPGDHLTISVGPNPGRHDGFRFRIACGESLVCSGGLQTTSGRSEPQRPF